MESVQAHQIALGERGRSAGGAAGFAAKSSTEMGDGHRKGGAAHAGKPLWIFVEFTGERWEVSRRSRGER